MVPAALLLADLRGIAVPAMTLHLSTPVHLYVRTTDSPSASLNSPMGSPHCAHMGMQASPFCWRSTTRAPSSIAMALNSSVGTM